MIQVSEAATSGPDSCRTQFSSILKDRLLQKNVIDPRQRCYYLHVIHTHLWSLSVIPLLTFQGTVCLLLRMHPKSNTHFAFGLGRPTLALHSFSRWLHIGTAPLKANPFQETLIVTTTPSALHPKSPCKKSHLWYRINTVAVERLWKCSKCPGTLMKKWARISSGRDLKEYWCFSAPVCCICCHSTQYSLIIVSVVIYSSRWLWNLADVQAFIDSCFFFFYCVWNSSTSVQ